MSASAAGPGTYTRGVHIHTLTRRQHLPASPEEVFPFFADAANLEAITPPFLGFEVITPRPIPMRVGTIIQYRLRLHGIPVSWLTSIQEWQPAERFVDVQVRGPYSLWHHTHTFEDDGRGGTIMGDRVRYALPLGAGGELARRLFVARDLERIFDFRAAQVARRFGAEA